MAGANLVEFTDGNFQSEVLNADKPVMVDFWAEWCMPCKMMLPTITTIAEKFAGKVKVGKLNIDNARDVAVKFGIQAIPTVIVFKGGQEVARVVGLKNEAEFSKVLEPLTK